MLEKMAILRQQRGNEGVQRTFGSILPEALRFALHVIIFCLFIPVRFAFAQEAGTVFRATPQEPAAQRQPTRTEPVGEDSPSTLRSWTWEGSFDKAGDATRSLEVELKNNPTAVACNPETLGRGSVPEQELQRRMAQCQQLQKEATGWAGSAEQIRKEQRIFAEVSRVSDVTAIGAIGAAGYAHLGKASTGQEGALQSAAKIQETAAVASYAAGATDLALGAYAFVQQKRKLEEMQNTLQKGRGGLSLAGGDSNITGTARAAAEQTTQAAYNHMLYGAGKMAVGYASAWAAKRNRQQAATMGSLPVVLPTGAINQSTPTAAVANQAPQNPSGNYDGGGRSNTPIIGGAISGITTATATATTTNNGAGTNNVVGAGMGTSVAPSFGTRSPSSVTKPDAPTSPSGIGAGSPPSSGTPQKEDPANAEALSAQGELAKESSNGSFELHSGGGGVPGYSGGKSGETASDPTSGIGNLLSNMLGENKGAATGINPNQIYREALSQGEFPSSNEVMAEGMSNSNETLFSTVKTKIRKMMELGRIQGPGAVEVRN